MQSSACDVEVVLAPAVHGFAGARVALWAYVLLGVRAHWAYVLIGCACALSPALIGVQERGEAQGSDFLVLLDRYE